MDTLRQFENASRLHAMVERVGLAVWNLQMLEHSAAVYLALAAHAKPGMGCEAGQQLLAKVERFTFGETVKRLVKTESLPEALKSRFAALVDDRNWLIHRSRLTERSGPYSDAACARVIERVDAIKDESSRLHNELRTLGELLARAHGIEPQEVAHLTERQLAEWKGDQA